MRRKLQLVTAVVWKVCAYERKGSSYVWLKWIDPVEKRQVFESSKIRFNDPQRQRKLAKKINIIEGRLLDRAPSQDGEAFDHWTVEFLTKRHEKNLGSLHKNLNSWNYLATYMREVGVSLPRELTRSHITGENNETGYINWRCSQVKQRSKRRPSKNTALYDLRVLGKILNEANLRGFCERNVARRLGISKDDTKEKPEILPDEQEKIEVAFHRTGMDADQLPGGDRNRVALQGNRSGPHARRGLCEQGHHGS